MNLIITFVIINMAPVMLVEICVFDDGNQKFKDYDNKWMISDRMRNGDKLKLVNFTNKDVIINSISSWKVLKIE